ncbi:MAG TPA: Fic family protein [Candidatus Angelobacter sp.]|nr:Fic family protein [Candidatus Angelobacter sp.]
MSLYWPAFEFNFTLDMARLLPHMAAIEASRAAASLRMLPPQWRAHSAAEVEARLRQAAAEQGTELEEIQFRKQVFLLSNASQAQAWVKQRFAPGSLPMCLEDVQTMHRMVSEEAGVHYETPGVMRQEGQGVITGTATIGIHVGAPAIKLPHLMDQYFRFIRSRRLLDLPAIIHALVAHFFITTIHPFGDGNGRVSRLVSAGILYQRGYNGHGFYALSNYFYENELRYHEILFRQQQEPCPDLTEFLAFGMEGLALELQGISNFIKIKLNRVAERKALAAARNSSSSSTLMASC